MLDKIDVSSFKIALADSYSYKIPSNLYKILVPWKTKDTCIWKVLLNNYDANQCHRSWLLKFTITDTNHKTAINDIIMFWYVSIDRCLQLKIMAIIKLENYYQVFVLSIDYMKRNDAKKRAWLTADYTINDY